VDLEFRKQWDKLVITLDVVDKDEESGTEVVHWVMHYPVSNISFPLNVLKTSLVILQKKYLHSVKTGQNLCCKA